MKFYNSLLCTTPEAFKAVNINLARSKSLFMVISQMPISTKHKSIIAFEFISVHNRASSDCFYSHRKKRLRGDVLYNIHSNNTISLENPEYRNLVISTSSSFSFASATKIGFIKLYRAVEKILGIFVICYNSNSNKSNGFQNRCTS